MKLAKKHFVANMIGTKTKELRFVHQLWRASVYHPERGQMLVSPLNDIWELKWSQIKPISKTRPYEQKKLIVTTRNWKQD